MKESKKRGGLFFKPEQGGHQPTQTIIPHKRNLTNKISTVATGALSPTSKPIANTYVATGQWSTRFRQSPECRIFNVQGRLHEAWARSYQSPDLAINIFGPWTLAALDEGFLQGGLHISQRLIMGADKLHILVVLTICHSSWLRAKVNPSPRKLCSKELVSYVIDVLSTVRNTNSVKIPSMACCSMSSGNSSHRTMPINPCACLYEHRNITAAPLISTLRNLAMNGKDYWIRSTALRVCQGTVMACIITARRFPGFHTYLWWWGGLCVLVLYRRDLI